MSDLRCGHQLHAKLTDDGRLEVKCGNRRCGATRGVVVLHYFDSVTGELVDTRRFSDPTKLIQNRQQVRRSA